MAMIIDKETQTRIASALKEAYRLSAVNGDVTFLARKEDELFFLNALPSLSKEEKNVIESDYLLLFPYKENRKLSFDLHACLGSNIFLIDVFDFERKRQPLSSLPVIQYVERLREGMREENIPEEYEDKVIAHFHAIVEKLLFLNFLRGERGLKDKSVRFYLPQVFLLSEETRKDYSLFSSINYIEREVLEKFVEPLGTIEKGDDGEIRPVLVKR